MSRPYELSARIAVDGSPEDLTILSTILDDEEKRIGQRASYETSRDNGRLVLDVHASDSTALKTAISAISAIIRTAEKTNNIGED